MHRCLPIRFGIVPLRLLLVACCLNVCLSAEAFAKEAKPSDAMKASTSRAAKQEAIEAIPLERIDPKHRRAVQKVIHSSSLFRRMPTGVVPCDADLFTFMMQHPDVLVDIWRELGISRVDLKRLDGNSFHLTDNAGTTARLTLVEQKCEPGAQNRIIMYAEGSYDGKPFKRPVRAQCVLLLRSGSYRETDGEKYIASRLDTFVRIDRTSIKLFAKALHPLVGKTADTNFLDTLNFVSSFSQAAEEKPATIERLVNSLPRTSRQLKQEMLQIAHRDGSMSVVTKNVRRLTEEKTSKR